MKPGDVLLVFCRSINPPKDKFAICLCPERRWFFFINSKPWWPPETQVEIKTHELRCLDRDSWVDTSKIVQLSASEIADARGDNRRRKGELSPMLRIKLRKTVESSETLREIEIGIVVGNLKGKG